MASATAFEVKLQLGTYSLILFTFMLESIERDFGKLRNQTGKYLLTRIMFGKLFISLQQSKSTAFKYPESIDNS